MIDALWEEIKQAQNKCNKLSKTLENTEEKLQTEEVDDLVCLPPSQCECDGSPFLYPSLK